MSKGKGVATSDSDRAKNLQLDKKPGLSPDRALAEVGLDPFGHALATTNLFNAGSFGKLSVTDTYEAISDHAKAIRAGDQSLLQNLLVGQSLALNSIFTELARRAALNMGEYIHASERYMRLALKAQAQSRATVEALERLTNGREQTVRHVHVNEGGQAVIADQFHHHTGGHQNAESVEQPRATAAVAAGSGSAMLGHDPQGNGLPIPGDQGREAMPDARGERKRRA